MRHSSQYSQRGLILSIIISSPIHRNMTLNIYKVLFLEVIRILKKQFLFILINIIIN